MPIHHWQSKDGVPEWVRPQPGTWVKAGNLKGQVRDVSPASVTIWWMNGLNVIAVQGVPFDSFTCQQCAVNMHPIEMEEE